MTISYNVPHQLDVKRYTSPLGVKPFNLLSTSKKLIASQNSTYDVFYNYITVIGLHHYYKSYF